MPAAVLTVHQARFMLAFGGSSGEELEKEGHQYLSALAAPIAMSVAIVVGLFFARLASNIGLERVLGDTAGRRMHLPDGSDRSALRRRTSCWGSSGTPHDGSSTGSSSCTRGGSG